MLDSRAVVLFPLAARSLGSLSDDMEERRRENCSNLQNVAILCRDGGGGMSILLEEMEGWFLTGGNGCPYSEMSDVFKIR